ncbi:MAG: hypothetical protein M1820_007937 [Bogoriella megaspora]|nr:MAG: hypothetical protein M1820_007937 [Bogoriella megaspora]
MITLCRSSVEPLVHSVSQWPFPQPPSGMGRHQHDVILTSEESNKFCLKCMITQHTKSCNLDKIDIFDLDASFRQLGCLKSSAKHDGTKTFESNAEGTILVLVDPSLKEGEVSSVGGNMYSHLDRMDSLTGDLHERTGLRTHGEQALKGPAGPGKGTQQWQQSGGKVVQERAPEVLKGSMLALPYTGGLGLLVLPKVFKEPTKEYGKIGDPIMNGGLKVQGIKAKL